MEPKPRLKKNDIAHKLMHKLLENVIRKELFGIIME
jgi:hypothetical protein